MVLDAFQRDVERISKALSIGEVLRPSLARRIHYQRTGIRGVDELIDFYARHERWLNKTAEIRLNELRIQREGMARRLAELTRRR